MKNSCTGLGLAGLLAALALQPVDAHSWAEMLKRIAPNGTMVGAPGYMRGYASRATAGFSDTMDTFLIPPNGRSTGNKILSTDSLCHPSQTIGNYSTEFPKLSAAAGDYVAIRYQENGHVTLPDINPTKPLNRGTVYIYGTDKPAADEKFLDVFQQWTADGTGGNGRGRLLATRNFDDGQCYQVNQNTISQQRQAEFSKVAEDPQGTDLWCQNDLQLPTDLATGSTYTLYWVWSWPTFDKAGAPTDIAPPGYTVTTNQFYTSCIDVDVTTSDSDGSTPASTSNQVKSKGGSIAASFLHGQDLNSAAVFSQLEMGAFEVAVPGSGNSSSGAAPSAGGGGSSSSTATTTSPTTTHGSGPETIVVTVTTTEAPVYITITVPASSSEAASAAPTTTSSSSAHKTHTHVTTIYDHATVTETVSMMPSSSSSSSSSSTSIFSRSSRRRSTSSTVSTTTDSGSRTPTMVPTVQPFLNGTSIVAGPGSTTLLRVPRYRRRA